jgi:[CysO sulfur-carrier protein]-S-L-cysteine hydrolase
MLIERPLLEELLAHVLEDPANELCGVVAVAADGAPPGGRRAVEVHRAANMHASPLRFEIEPIELLRLNEAIEDSGCELGAIYHSHVRSRPYPSQTDINYAGGWPGVEWIIVGLAEGEPEVRSYLIEGGRVREVPLEVG